MKFEDRTVPALAVTGEENEIHLHGKCLFRFALARVRNEIAARDLVQETFLAAIRSRDSFRSQSCLRVWLVGILRHKIADYFRRTSREVSLLSRRVPADVDGSGDHGEHFKVLRPAEVQDPRHSPSGQVDVIEFWEALDLALGRLPSRTARIFQLYEIEGETGASVCAQLQISPENLWVTLHRARKKLCEDLAPWRSKGA